MNDITLAGTNYANAIAVATEAREAAKAARIAYNEATERLTDAEQAIYTAQAALLAATGAPEFRSGYAT